MSGAVEKLTDEERAWLEQKWHGAKALRIIDQLTAALEAAEKLAESRLKSFTDAYAAVQHLKATVVDKEIAYDMACTRAAAAESRAEALQAEVTRLTAALEAAERDAVERLAAAERKRAEHHSNWLKACRARDAAESELADLRMANRECQEVASRNAADATHLRQTAITLETELADLRGRVERVMKVYPYFESDLEGTTLAVALELLRGR